MTAIFPVYPQHGEGDWDEPLVAALSQIVALANVHDDSINTLAGKLALVSQTSTSSTFTSSASKNTDGTWTVRFGSGTPTALLPSITSIAAPVISGVFQTGNILTVSSGVWSTQPESYAYQWFRNGFLIQNAILSTYVPATADIGQALTVGVTAYRNGYLPGNSSTLSVAISAAVAPNFTNYASPIITGTPAVGATLTVTEGSWNPAPDQYYYQWMRNGSSIINATQRTYQVATADIGANLTVQVTGVKSGYSTAVAVSAYVTAVAGLVSSSAKFTASGSLAATGIASAITTTSNHLLAENGNTLTAESGDRLILT